MSRHIIRVEDRGGVFAIIASRLPPLGLQTESVIAFVPADSEAFLPGLDLAEYAERVADTLQEMLEKR